jgi:hypothetical protein
MISITAVPGGGGLWQIASPFYFSIFSRLPTHILVGNRVSIGVFN